jgi:outer membrane protein assembly factor BamB
MKKHLISLLVLFLMVSSSLVGVSNQVTDDLSEVLSDGGLQDSAWPMFQHDTRHTGRSQYAPGQNGNLPIIKWMFQMDAGISSPVIDVDGIIYIGAEDFHKSIYSIYPNGTERWCFDVGFYVDSTPAIGSDGIIYIGSNTGSLYAFYSNGTQKWQVSLGSGWAFASPVIDENGIIYCASVGSNRLCAINPNGTMKWYFNAENYVYCSPALDENGVIYIGSNDGYLYSVFPNGSMNWKYYCGGSLGVAEVSVGNNGLIYCGATSGYLYALYPNGTLQWMVKTGWIGGCCPAIADDGTIYIGDQQYHRIYAVNPNGSIKWYYQAQDDILSSPIIDNNGIIYCGSYDKYLYAFNPDGTLKWKFLTYGGIESSPAIDDNGIIYIGSYKYLYALEIINDTAPTLPTITGMEGGKVRHKYDYTIVSSDPEDDNISYYIDWGDGKTTDWIGPYDSGEEIIQSHLWLVKGTYEVKVKARDGHGMESDWGILSVTMPYEPPHFQFFEWLLERFPNAFPILRFLLEFNH